MISHPASSKSLYFRYRLTSDWSPGEMPLTRKGNQTKRSLKSVRKPGRLLVGESGCQRAVDAYAHACAIDDRNSLYRRSGPAEVDELAEEVDGEEEEAESKALHRAGRAVEVERREAECSRGREVGEDACGRRRAGALI